MAKRRKRARVGSSVTNELSTIGGLLIGAIAGNILDNTLLTKVDDTIVNVGEIGVGTAIAMYAPGDFIKNIGRGMSVDGATKVLSGALAKVNGVAGTNLNRRVSAVGKSMTSGGGSGKMSADTWEVV